MSFDFDRPVDRRGTNSDKWDNMQARYGVSPDDGLAMWVADMDFQSPPAVNATLRNIAEHGVHGYFGDDRAYLAAICGWMGRRHDWEVKPEWILTTPGLVSAIGFVVQACSEPGDGVIIFPPVYHGFARMVRHNDRRLVESQLVQRDGRYVMDLDALEATLTGDEKIVIFCSPHNPGGRVWSEAELGDIAQFCIDHDLILISDEVHHDHVYPGHAHHVLANAAPEIESRLVTLTAASKAFNLADTHTGNMIVADPELRGRLKAAIRAVNLSPTRLGALMVAAAYAHGEDWLTELLAYLDRNRRAFDARINAIPGLVSMELQSTFLSWVDFSGTGMDDAEIIARVQDTAKIAASHGTSFGTGGEGFLRFNIGTTHANVLEATDRLAQAFSDLQ